MLRTCLAALALAFAASSLAQTKQPSHGKAEHVVLVVFDGMRPDFVTADHAPNLKKLAQSGVWFRNHHSVYPSLTNVNATALATGVYPGRSGMIANWAFRPELNGGKLARLDAPEIIRKADSLSDGHYLQAPTIAELVRAHGGRTAIAGTKTAALLHDRQASGGSVTLFAGDALPKTALVPIEKSLGKFPESDALPNIAEDAWTTRALTESLWSDGVPEFSVLWLSEPDRSQHATGPGSKVSLAAIKSADANLGLLLRALEAKGLREKTDVLVASDHGFSTVDHAINVPKLLRDHDIEVAGEDESELRRGRVRVAGNGGMNLYYVGEHDAATIARLVELLQQSDFAGVIFTRASLPGTFRLADAHLEITPGPDVLMSFRWSDGRNEEDVPGMIDSNGLAAVRGTHGTLSPSDLHNCFVATGPDFHTGMVDALPTSNLDVAATVVRILGINTPQPLDGRVVSEAMTVNADVAPAAEAKPVTQSSERQFPSGVWRQSLDTSVLGSKVYIDQGRGSFTPK